MPAATAVIHGYDGDLEMAEWDVRLGSTCMARVADGCSLRCTKDVSSQVKLARLVRSMVRWTPRNGATREQGRERDQLWNNMRIVVW